MYNGIGLQSARGSGTSGFVQKSASYNIHKLQTKQQFLKHLQQARHNNLPVARKANLEIIQHQRKRQIYIQKMRLKAKLEEQGLKEEEIMNRLEKAEKIIRDKLEKGEYQTKNKDTHVMTEAKQRQYTKLTEIFGIKQSGKPGSAFDFEGQREERLKQLEERRKRLSFTCHHEGCQKSYDSQQRLNRHLKYKHIEKQKEILNDKFKIQQKDKKQSNKKQ